MRSDSPTCPKENARMLLVVAVAKDWKINSLDLKVAFLQGKEIERSVFITPPKEFRSENCLWKFKKVVYGFCDASRSWYLRVLEVLKDLGMKMSTLDRAVFTYGKQKLEGVLLIHVDDVFFFGTGKFLKEVIEPFKSTFKISRQDAGAFKYLGINMIQSEDGVELNQKGYLATMKQELVPKEATKMKSRLADKEEQKLFKQGVGQLGWLANITRPEASFMYCTLSTVQSKPKMEDFTKYSKAVKDLKNEEAWMKIRRLDLKTLKISVFSDASFGNLPGGAS